MARIERSIHVNVPVHAAYNQWTQFTEFPRFMEGVKEVRQIDDAHLHWRAEKGGKEVEWDTEITQQVPDKCIEWRSVSGQANGGIVTFQPEPDDKTMIVFKMETENDDTQAQQTADQDLMRFKNIIESQGRETGAWRGEIKDSKVQGGGEEQPANERQDATQSAAPESTTQESAQPESGSQKSAESQSSNPTDMDGASQGKQPNGHDEQAQTEVPIQSGGQPEQGGQQARGQGEQQHRQQDQQQGGSTTGAQGQPEGGQQPSQQSNDQSQGSMTQSSPQDQQMTQPGMADDPQAWIPNLMHVWDEPLAMMRRMTQGMDQLFDRLVARPAFTGGMPQAWIPLVEIAHRDNQLHISADLPGIPKEAVRVEIHNNKLTIEGERSEESQQNIGQQYRRTERTYGRFYREIPLPEGVDPNSARATMRDGILDITVPVPPPTPRGRRLDIGSNR